MQKNYAIKYAIFPNKEQKHAINQIFGATRYVYNYCLGELNNRYNEWKKNPNKPKPNIPINPKAMYSELVKPLRNNICDENGYYWLKDIDSSALAYTCEALSSAYKNFFRGCKTHKDIGFPKFKSKFNRNKSYTTQKAKITNGKLQLPIIYKKYGLIDIDIHREIEGDICYGTISCDSCGGYYIAFSIKKEVEEPKRSSDKAIGIDMGVTHFCTTSDGEFIDLPKKLDYLYKKRNKIAKNLSRKRKGSNNYEKNRIQLAKNDKHIKNVRKQFHHKATRALVDKYGIIVAEDLDIKNMSKSAKGTIDNPGKNVKAKSGLNRSITQQGWGEFFTMLDYKQKWNGGEFKKVKPQYTSQTCSVCGNIDKNNRKSQSKFVCCECGHTENADVNAAKNILMKN